MIKIEHVRGKNKGKIMLYALSTCGWCHKTKELLKDLGVEYYYIFVDQLEDSEKEQQMREVSKYNPHRSFPTLVINNDKCIVGFKEDEIKEALGK